VPRGVEHVKNLHRIAPHPVGNNVGRPGDNELARPRYAPGTATFGIGGDFCAGLPNALNQPVRGRRIFFGDVIGGLGQASLSAP